ncbi:MAG: septum site-determining protein MinD [Firmicutes bacterium]|nr:septum site-determining protein MinD [Bacillota bacterium]
MCEIMAITSGTGGAGKTMFASNIAYVLARQGKKVLLIDMNTGLRNLDICLGIENHIIFDLSDIIAGICSTDRALIRDKRFQGLYLLSASQNYEKAEIRDIHMKKLCSSFSSRFDNIIIDAPPGFGMEWRAAVAPVGRAVILMTQDHASVRDTDAVSLKLQEAGVKKRFVVINKIKSEYSRVSVFPQLNEISQMLRVQIAGAIQEDINIHIAMNKGIPIVCQRDTYIEKNFEKICEKIFL